MKKLCLLALLFLVPFAALPAAAQLQYFGYVGSADDDVSLGKTKGYTNFAHLSTTTYINDTFVKTRVTALSQRGSKAMIDLGYVLEPPPGIHSSPSLFAFPPAPRPIDLLATMDRERSRW